MGKSSTSQQKLRDIESTSLNEKETILSQAYEDLIFFGRAFLPRDFLRKSKSPPFHYEIGQKLISTKPGERICNIVPLESQFLQKLQFYIKYVLGKKMTRILLLG